MESTNERSAFDDAVDVTNLCAVWQSALEEIFNLGEGVIDCQTVRHRSTFQELTTAAVDCQLCFSLHDRIVRSADQDLLTEIAERDPECKFTLRSAALLARSKDAEGIAMMYYGAVHPTASVHLFCEQLAGPHTPFLGRLVARFPPLDLAARWLTECTSSHENCNAAGTSFLPSRLIHLSQRGPRLVNTVVNEQVDYAALSHCWGTAPSLLCTNKANLASMLEAIPEGQLPRTYTDAITVARALGLEYLWIDSLCIIQDDAEDWRRECERMGSIYANALITIAAVLAAEPHDGILTERSIREEAGLLIRRSVYAGSERDAVVLRLSSVATLSRKDIYNRQANTRQATDTDLQRGPNTRAWCFQERMMSTRILSFASDRMYFECLTCENHERLREPVKFSTNRNIGDRVRFHTSIWHNIAEQGYEQDLIHDYCRFVAEYSTRSLTQPSDRLPAFSAIARWYHTMTKDRYLAGLWQSHIISGLYWIRKYVHGDEGLYHMAEQDSADLSAPTWSWASYSSGVRFFPSGIIENDNFWHH